MLFHYKLLIAFEWIKNVNNQDSKGLEQYNMLIHMANVSKLL